MNNAPSLPGTAQLTGLASLINTVGAIGVLTVCTGIG